MENFGDLHDKYLEVENRMDRLQSIIFEKESELAELELELKKTKEMYNRLKSVVCAWIDCDKKLNDN